MFFIQYLNLTYLLVNCYENKVIVNAVGMSVPVINEIKQG